MDLQITAINMELTPRERHHVENKLGKLNRHLPLIIKVKAEISEEKTRSPQQHFMVRVTVNGKGAVFHGEERGNDLFRAIDKVATTMIRQLEHYKGKLYEKGRGNSLTRDKFSENLEATEPARKIAKVKRFTVKPMSVAEATEQMELLGHDFFLFFNADTEGLNLLYRRKDGDYGLIELELE